MRANVDRQRERESSAKKDPLSLSLRRGLEKRGGVRLQERNDNGRPWLSDGKMASHDSDVTGGGGRKEDGRRGGVVAMGVPL